MTVAPKKALGQHFLVDENILGVIERLSDLHSTDVVLEIGPGLGILTRRLAERARFVHAIELDRSLEAELRAALSDHANVRLVWGDALQLAIDELEPEPTKLVANLPYNVATPLVVESLEHASSIAALVRDGAARGGRPLLRRAEDEGVRRGLGARAALRPEGRASMPFRRRCSVRSRESTPRSWPSSVTWSLQSRRYDRPSRRLSRIVARPPRTRSHSRD